MANGFTPGTELGHMFEVGFNIGLLKALLESGIQIPDASLYREDLQQLKLDSLVDAMARRISVVAETGRETIQKWITGVVAHGYLSGYSFWQDLASTFGHSQPIVRYLQIRFDGANSLGTTRTTSEQIFRRWLAQLNIEDDTLIHRYQFKPGVFLQADTLLLLEVNRQWRMVVLDLSIFTVQSITNLADLSHPEVMRRLLRQELSYANKRGQFTRIAFDTKPGEFAFAAGLENYYRAFSRTDKESYKLIQAGSYAYTFYQFLQEQSLLDQRPLTFQVFGYSDRGVNAINVGTEELSLLQQCTTIYQSAHQAEANQQSHRDKVLQVIATNAGSSFEPGGRAFIQELLKRDFRVQPPLISYRETIRGFTNTGGVVPAGLGNATSSITPTSLRNLHADTVQTYLAPEATENLLFLTGAPGIGKTTALSRFCRDHRDEGFLFLYFSPRTQVNRDLLDKFEEWTTPEDSIISVFSTASTIDKYGQGKSTVLYRSKERSDTFRLGDVQFVSDNTPQFGDTPRRNMNSVLDDQFVERDQRNAGVLNSLCKGIQLLMRNDLADSVVATASIQSLKVTERGTTLDHIEKIFADGYRRDRGPLWDKLKTLSRKRKHLIVMIDEVTGDSAGVAFLDGIIKLFQKLGLFDAKSGFNTKIVVADASIVDASVIQSHLKSASSERDKVYFRKALPNDQPIQVEHFNFKSLNAVAINANCFPAASLDLVYHAFIETLNSSVNPVTYSVRKKIDDALCQDIVALLESPEEGQILVYLQDKAWIGRIIEAIGDLRKQQGQTWQRTEDYLEIHAYLGDEEKRQVNFLKSRVKIVFMTSTASRGLSFPNARRILVVIPGFAIEQNLMEIIQVIYRGRGDPKQEALAKTLHFYVGEQIIYDTDSAYESAVRERLLSLINLLLILKTSVMTRIQGYGVIGRERVMMVPVGGKGLTTAGDSFGTRMAETLRSLASARRQQPDDARIRHVERELHQLLSTSEVKLYQNNYSYLNLARDFDQKIAKTLLFGFDHLLNVPVLEHGLTVGSLVIVPLQDRRVIEQYQVYRRPDLQTFLKTRIYPALKELSVDPHLPESLQHHLRYVLGLIGALLNDQSERSQRVVDTADHPDLYYALPIWSIINYGPLRDYFAQSPQEPEEFEFRTLLGKLIRSHYPTEAMLPLTTHYAEFPWLLFRSRQLQDLRKRIFNGKEVLATTEFNVLNLILSKGDG